jgi:ribonuclease HII
MKEAVAWGIGQCSPKEIDEINILKASFLAMHRAVDQLTTQPEMLLIDGNRFTPYQNLPHHCQVKGDATYLHIAAASILAKTERDLLMEELHQKHPEYDWQKNKGYPTKKHRNAIREFGPTKYHRMSFQLLPRQLTLDLK